MHSRIEQWIAGLWNRFSRREIHRNGLVLGMELRDGQEQGQQISIPQLKRLEHIVLLGKTGTGKSSLLRHLIQQDIKAGRGFALFDLHGDTLPFILATVAHQERERSADLSDRLIVVEPGDKDYSVGLNVLEQTSNQQMFVQIAEFAQILKQRWHLDSFGPRTEELLRNSLHIVADNGLTLLEIAPLLTNSDFRDRCLSHSTNAEVSAYFATRFNRASEAMQSVFREAVLNKITGFTIDPRLRHILGQKRSTFSLVQALDEGKWIVFNLDKGRLGEQAAVMGSLLLTGLKNAAFARARRSLFTFYCDELQNLVTFDAGLDTLLSEARKFGLSICSANQFLDQYPPQMKAAVMSVGTHVLFQLSSFDAEKMANALNGGRHLAELLKNLSQRHFVIKSGYQRWREVVAPEVAKTRLDFTDLYKRCRQRWARLRSDIEQEVSARHAEFNSQPQEVLNAWD